MTEILLGCTSIVLIGGTMIRYGVGRYAVAECNRGNFAPIMWCWRAGVIKDAEEIVLTMIRSPKMSLVAVREFMKISDYRGLDACLLGAVGIPVIVRLLLAITFGCQNRAEIIAQGDTAGIRLFFAIATNQPKLIEPTIIHYAGGAAPGIACDVLQLVYPTRELAELLLAEFIHRGFYGRFYWNCIKSSNIFWMITALNASNVLRWLLTDDRIRGRFNYGVVMPRLFAWSDPDSGLLEIVDEQCGKGLFKDWPGLCLQHMIKPARMSTDDDSSVEPVELGPNHWRFPLREAQFSPYEAYVQYWRLAPLWDRFRDGKTGRSVQVYRDMMCERHDLFPGMVLALLVLEREGYLYFNYLAIRSHLAIARFFTVARRLPTELQFEMALIWFVVWRSERMPPLARLRGPFYRNRRGVKALLTAPELAKAIIVVLKCYQE